MTALLEDSLSLYAVCEKGNPLVKLQNKTTVGPLQKVACVWKIGEWTTVQPCSTGHSHETKETLQEI